jgi:hypothetical protein
VSANAQVVWRKHPTSPKWHAYRVDVVGSACGLTNKAVGEGQTAVPPWPDACWRCCQVLGVTTSTRCDPPPTPKSVIEEMQAEFLGGPFDGELLTLKVVRESARNHRVLEVAYERPWIEQAARELATEGMSEVVRPAKETAK